MRFLLRPGVVRPPLCFHRAAIRSLSTTPRLRDDVIKSEPTKTQPKQNPMSKGKLRALLAASAKPYHNKHDNRGRPSQTNHGKGYKPRVKWDSAKGGTGRHAMFRSTVLNRFQGVLKKFSRSDVSVVGVGEEELDRQASLFTDVLEKAFAMAEKNITQRDRNPLFWNLRDAFILKDVRGLSNELQYSFQSFLIRQRFSKGLEESHKRLLDFRFPYEWFPATRTMQRTIHLHVGPTNSGKTYRALKALENSKRGVYAGPLRLLANEVYQRLLAKGLPCALMTGEEVRVPQDTDTYFTSCTVEMTPVNEPYDVAVIDEIQMIADPDRGSGWTTALLGVMAKEVHLCGEERTVKLIQSICASIGDECIVHRYERLSPLETMSEAIDEDYNRLEKGDAIVAFSRMNLHALKTTIEKHTGRRCAIIYGSLPPEVRVQQAALFNDPDNDYDFIVASDAIGMGLNLEIRRVVLDSVTKFDGNQNRLLTYPEMKQIGGRAGRYRTARQATETDTGADDGRKVGYVTTMARQDLKNVHRAFRSSVDDIEAAFITPPAAAVERFSTYFPKDTPLSFILMRIRELASVSKNFRLSIAPDKLQIADAIQDIPLTIYDRLTLCHLPVWHRAENSMAVLRALATVISESGRGDLLSIKEIPLESLDIDLKDFKGTPIDYLHKLESLHVAINQYVWLSYRFNGMFRDQALAFHVRSLVEQKLVDTLDRLDFTQFDLQSIRQNKRLMAQSQKLSRKVLGEGDLKDVEQETDDPPLDQDEHWEPHQRLDEVGATASAP
ncbi:RNA helicase [Fusarium piperis]|uniref:ATP-dependent RNA helicase SUV3, mitochondrial n=1 Tax=Fusarium piperis TaxID=1435070 RepID=A0A9W9BPA6_9HYPO|nr:RNA helicase [Fusarium piperis]